MMIRATLLATAAAAATPARACPTAEDMKTGVEVFYNADVGDVYSTRFRAISKGQIQSKVTHAGTLGYIATFHLGVFETEFEDLTPDTDPAERTGRITYGFELPDKISPWTSFTGSYTEHYDNGETISFPVKYSFLGAQDFEIGPCRYASIPFDYVAFKPGETLHGSAEHLVDLGIDVETGLSDPTSGFGVTITPVHIQVAQ